MAKSAFTPTCQYEYEVWDECGDPAVAWLERKGWRGWVCEFHKLGLERLHG